MVRYTLPPATEVELLRKVWGSPDAILLIFAASAAEFAVNKSVDWLFVTKALPNAPLERFFSTVAFAQAMMFGDEAMITKQIDTINRIHQRVEQKRGSDIPQWSYRDVLFMLIDYAMQAYTIVYGPLTAQEREHIFEASIGMGRMMHITDLPTTYAEYQAARTDHLLNDTDHTPFTDQMYAAYRGAVGPIRLKAAKDVQASLVPERVRQLLGLKRKRRVDLLLRVYRFLPGGGRKLRWLYPILLPKPYASRLHTLEALA